MGIRNEYFAALHRHLASSFAASSCGCEECKSASLSNGKKQVFADVLKKAEEAFLAMYAGKPYNPEELESKKEYRDLLNSINDVFQSAIITQEMPAEMLDSLRNDAFVFFRIKDTCSAS